MKLTFDFTIKKFTFTNDKGESIPYYKAVTNEAYSITCTTKCATALRNNPAYKDYILCTINDKMKIATLDEYKEYIASVKGESFID